MSTKNSISGRTQRLNKTIVSCTDDSNNIDNKTIATINRETLLDAFDALYTECNRDALKSHNPNILDFTKKFRDPLNSVRKLRVNIEDFTLKNLIGKGYFGEVHLAFENVTRDVYAIKKIPKTSFVHSKEERNILAINRCDWIPTLQYAFQDQSHLYLVMEYLPGGDLFSLMVRNNTFPEDVIQFYLAEITLALNALHTLGYAHRDVKPENILLDRFGHLKLTDFGSAAIIEKDGQITSFTPIGTPDYIAPELLQPIHSKRPMKTTYNETCDFWSMGVVAYEMLTESNPFRCDNIHDTYEQILDYIDCDEPQKLQFTNIELEVSDNLKDLINGLVTKKNRRFNYRKIITHPFFHGVDWMNVRQQVPPIIPSLNGEDDTSNFEEENRKYRRNKTFDLDTTISLKSSSFSGNDLPFVGYGYVHDETAADGMLTNESSRSEVTRLNSQVKRLQKTIDTQMTDISLLQQSLTEYQRKNAQMTSIKKDLTDTKAELHTLKDELKEKTVEIAKCRTQIKTLKNSLKIEEEQRAKNDANISDVLNSTYQKWERAKKLSEQNYEKQIAEKNAEIMNMQQKLKLFEMELETKSAECANLQQTIDDFKDRLKSSKNQNDTEKTAYARKHRESNVHFEGQIRELRSKLQKQTDAKHTVDDENEKLRNQIEENSRKMKVIADQKAKLDQANAEITQQLEHEIDENHKIRDEKHRITQQLQELQNRIDELTTEVRRNRRSIISPRTSIDGGSASVYCSLESISSELENQLKKDLALAKESEIHERSRANNLAETVERLEAVIKSFQKEGMSSVDSFLERKTEKLEEKLSTVQEQAILDRQKSRTACLEQWKSQNELKTVMREKQELEQTVKKVQNERDELERKIKENRIIVRSREERITELQSDLAALKKEVQIERSRWEKDDEERKKDKAKIVNQDTKIYKLEIDLAECRSKMRLFEQQKNAVALKNQELTQQLRKESDQLEEAIQKQNEYEQSYETLTKNHEMLKKVCSLMETQLNELEEMYNAQLEQNKTKSVTIDKLWEDIRERDGKILKLQQEIRDEKTQKLDIDQKSTETSTELSKVKETLNDCHERLTNLHSELMEKTESLMKAEELLEVQKDEIDKLQRVNKTMDHELRVMKEDISKVRTEWMLQLEDNGKLKCDYKTLKEDYADLEKEVEQLSATMSEVQEYHKQREVKTQATQAQYTKLIDYLQQRVDELSQKKKKTLAEVLFGANSSNSSSKKENVPPTISRLQDDLKREKIRSSQMKSQSTKTSKATKSSTLATSTKTDEKIQRTQSAQEPRAKDSTVKSKVINADKMEMHRFERTSQTNGSNIAEQCLVCKKHFLSDSIYQCEKCKACVHQYCRGSNMKCTVGKLSTGDSSSTDTSDTASSIVPGKLNYTGDIVLKESDSIPAIKINCMYEMDDNILLLGCASGLKSYNINTQKLIHVANLDGVTGIAVVETFPKSLIIIDDGKKLIQCDLRQLQTRAKASVCLNTGLNYDELNIPGNRSGSSYDQLRLVRIYDKTERNEEISEPIAIAASQTRIVIWRYNVNSKRFEAKNEYSLDTAEPVESIYFTSKLSAIVSSNKFYEIFLSQDSLEYQEFCDECDDSLTQLVNSKPMAAFGINRDEYLLCFKDAGVFVDENGHRMRPNDLKWMREAPTSFEYRGPILFVFYKDGVQVIRISKSASNDFETDVEQNDEKILQTYVEADGIQAGTKCGKYGIFALATRSSGNSTTSQAGAQYILRIDGTKALRNALADSLETILSDDIDY